MRSTWVLDAEVDMVGVVGADEEDKELVIDLCVRTGAEHTVP
jgi:hypothetical protein